MQYMISFLEGIITFISPCLLPMLPIYISYFAGGGERSTKKTMKCALGFILYGRSCRNDWKLLKITSADSQYCLRCHRDFIRAEFSRYSENQPFSRSKEKRRYHRSWLFHFRLIRNYFFRWLDSMCRRIPGLSSHARLTAGTRSHRNDHAFMLLPRSWNSLYYQCPSH